jgi:hypothetical protein
MASTSGTHDTLQGENTNGSIKRLEQIIAMLRSENKSLRGKIGEATRERARLARDNEALRKSFSWRLTSPLRAAIDTGRRLTRKRPAAVTSSSSWQDARPDSSQRIKPMAMNHGKATIGVIIVTCGEPQFEACRHSINAQTLKADKIDVVRDVYPMSAAFNEVLKLSTCDYSVTVDADMVLDPHALETLYNDIGATEDNVFGIGYRLRDPYYGAIGNIKILKSSLLRTRTFRDQCGCDRVLEKELNDEGYVMRRRDETLGVHLPDATPEQLFKRSLGTARKFLKFGDFPKSVKLMARKWCDEDDKTALAGLIGYCGGLLLDHPDEEKDFRTFGKSEWRRIDWMFES